MQIADIIKLSDINYPVYLHYSKLNSRGDCLQIARYTSLTLYLDTKSKFTPIKIIHSTAVAKPKLSLQ